MLIDVSGYSYSGKGAVLDILRDFPAIHVHKKEFEFLLIRTTDGLLDLRNHIINNSSEIRVDMALRRFINLTKNLSASPTKISNPMSFFTPPGQDYSDIFPCFEEYTNDFINQISTCTYEYWPFPALYKSNLSSFFEKISKVMNSNKNTKKYISMVSKEEFDKHLNTYLRKVLLNQIYKNKTKVATSNMLEVYNPIDFFQAIQPCKLIIVDRDPRGIFISIPGNIHNLENQYKVTEFIEKYKFQRSKKFLENLGHENVLILKYEHIFKNFKSFIEKICIFLDEPAPINFKNFSIDKSKPNLDLWMCYRNSKAIKIIEKELSQYIDY